MVKKNKIEIEVKPEEPVSDEEIQRPKAQPKKKIEPVAESVAEPIAEPSERMGGSVRGPPVATLKPKRKNNVSEQGKQKIMENLEKAQMVKKIKDLETRLNNGGKSNTELTKEEKRKKGDEIIYNNIKKIYEENQKKTKKESRGFLESESESDSEPVIIVKKPVRKPRAKKIIVEEPELEYEEAPRRTQTINYFQSGMDGLNQALQRDRPRSYFI